MYYILYKNCHFIWFYGQNLNFVLVLTSLQENKLKVLSLIPLYSFVCLICKTLLNSLCFTSVISFHCLAMSLHQNLPILNFWLVYSLALHMQWTTQVENWQFHLILLLSSTHFDHASEVHAHLATVAANMSSLAKVTVRETLQIVMWNAVHPLIQMHIPEGFLNLTEDNRSQTMEEEWLQKVEKTMLP